MIGVTVVPAQLTVAKATQAFDTEGRLTRPEDLEGLRQAVADLAVALDAHALVAV